MIGEEAVNGGFSSEASKKQVWEDICCLKNTIFRSRGFISQWAGLILVQFTVFLTTNQCIPVEPEIRADSAGWSSDDADERGCSGSLSPSRGRAKYDP